MDMLVPAAAGLGYVLVAEDDAFIGLDLCDALEAAGYRVVGPIATAEAILAEVEREKPGFAVLDVMLKDGPAGRLAQELRRHGIPFLIHSGRSRREPLAAEFRGAPWLDKPAWPRDVVSALGELSGPSQV